ncbi:hypothetical protein LCGC14_3078210, partial [marine sediment metagenome]
IDILGREWQNVQGMNNPIDRANAFAQHMMAQTKNLGIKTSLRLGPGEMAEQAFRNIGQQFEREAIGSRDFITRLQGVANVLTQPAQYTMDAIEAYSRYIPSVASSFSWHLAPATGRIIAAGKLVEKSITGWRNVVMPAARAIPGDQWTRSYVLDQLTPMMRGLKPRGAFLRASAFGQYKQDAFNWLTKHPLPKKTLTENGRQYLLKYFGDFGNLGADSLGAKISHHFYLSTLGLNISPASKNLLQNYLTTIHIPGITLTGLKQGMNEMHRGVAKYAGLIAKGNSRTDAFEKAFPDYINAIGKGGGTARSILGGGDILSEGVVVPKVATVIDKIKTGMMTPFSTSETYNR